MLRWQDIRVVEVEDERDPERRETLKMVLLVIGMVIASAAPFVAIGWAWSEADF